MNNKCISLEQNKNLSFSANRKQYNFLIEKFNWRYVHKLKTSFTEHRLNKLVNSRRRQILTLMKKIWTICGWNIYVNTKRYRMAGGRLDC